MDAQLESCGVPKIGSLRLELSMSILCALLEVPTSKDHKSKKSPSRSALHLMVVACAVERFAQIR